MHTGEALYQCKICKEGFNIKLEIKKHKEKFHSNSRKYVCYTCHAKFSEKIGLGAHLKIHSNNKDFYCPFPNCRRGFLTKGNMKCHFKTHVNFINYIHLLENYLTSKKRNKKDSLPESSNHIDNSMPVDSDTQSAGRNLEHEFTCQNKALPIKNESGLKLEHQDFIAIVHKSSKTKVMDETKINNDTILADKAKLLEEEKFISSLKSQNQEIIKSLESTQADLKQSYGNFTNLLQIVNNFNLTLLNTINDLQRIKNNFNNYSLSIFNDFSLNNRPNNLINEGKLINF